VYGAQAKEFGLVPSTRAIRQAFKMQQKLKDASDEDFHPALKRMSLSP
jgi:hypothetical protein